MKPQITIIGDITLDLISSPLPSLPKEDTETFTHFTPKLGGQAAHCALALAKLGIKTKFLACLGKDPYGEILLQKLKKQKNLQLKLQRKSTTALSFILLTPHKRTITNDLGANAHFSSLNLKEINTPYLFLGGFWHLKKLNFPPLLKYAKKKNLTTFMDLGYNPHPHYQKLNQALPYLDYFFLDKKELLLYTRQKTFPQALKKIPPTCSLALHLAQKGSALYQNKKLLQIPPKKIYHGDTTGAGDFWNAAFICGIIKKWPIKKILTFANHFAISSIKEKLHNL